MKKYDEVVNEIIRRVKANDIPLEDGEFTIDGVVYKTVEIDECPMWKTTYMGYNFTRYERVCICKLLRTDEFTSDLNELTNTGIFIAQRQFKKFSGKNDISYNYDNLISVKPQTEEFITAGWVKV